MTNAACTHHWVLDNAGIVAHGVCRKCGAEREFENRLGGDKAKPWEAFSLAPSIPKRPTVSSGTATEL